MFTLCGGGCAFQALVHSGNLLGPDEEFCRIMDVFFRIYLVGELNELMQESSVEASAVL